MSEKFLLYKYFDNNGNFNYEEYEKVQTAGNKKKLKLTWVLKSDIVFLSDYIISNLRSVDFGICHGTRRGKEQAWFRDYLDCEVIGTEISDTATKFSNTIQWDFHEVKSEWIGSVDFIYSNSLDHSYDPEKCINAWMSCLKSNGVCILEHTTSHETITRLDPFGAKRDIMPYLILEWGRGKYSVREILTNPFNKKRSSCKFFIIKNNY